jgi:hypothetical protein
VSTQPVFSYNGTPFNIIAVYEPPGRTGDRASFGVGEPKPMGQLFDLARQDPSQHRFDVLTTKMDRPVVHFRNSYLTVLALALPFNATLISLTLDYSEVTDEMATTLANALHFNSTLQDLFLDRNRIGDTGATALATALQFNSTLTRLFLVSNQITDIGALAMAEMLKSNSTLLSLLLAGNPITYLGAMTFAKALEANSTLSVLSLTEDPLSQEFIDTIEVITVQNLSRWVD